MAKRGYEEQASSSCVAQPTDKPFSIAFYNIGMQNSALQGPRSVTHYDNLAADLHKLQLDGCHAVCILEAGVHAQGFSSDIRDKVRERRLPTGSTCHFFDNYVVVSWTPLINTNIEVFQVTPGGGRNWHNAIRINVDEPNRKLLVIACHTPNGQRYKSTLPQKRTAYRALAKLGRDWLAACAGTSQSSAFILGGDLNLPLDVAQEDTQEEQLQLLVQEEAHKGDMAFCGGTNVVFSLPKPKVGKSFGGCSDAHDAVTVHLRWQDPVPIEKRVRLTLNPSSAADDAAKESILEHWRGVVKENVASEKEDEPDFGGDDDDAMLPPNEASDVVGDAATASGAAQPADSADEPDVAAGGADEPAPPEKEDSAKSPSSKSSEEGDPPSSSEAEAATSIYESCEENDDKDLDEEAAKKAQEAELAATTESEEDRLAKEFRHFFTPCRPQRGDIVRGSGETPAMHFLTSEEVKHNMALLFQARTTVLRQHNLREHEVLDGEEVGECIKFLIAKFEELPQQQSNIRRDAALPYQKQRGARRSRFQAWFKQEMGSTHVAKLLMQHGRVDAATLRSCLEFAMREREQDRAAQPIVSPEEQKRRRNVALAARDVFRYGRSISRWIAAGKLRVRRLTADQRWHYNYFKSGAAARDVDIATLDYGFGLLRRPPELYPPRHIADNKAQQSRSLYRRM